MFTVYVFAKASTLNKPENAYSVCGKWSLRDLGGERERIDTRICDGVTVKVVSNFGIRVLIFFELILFRGCENSFEAFLRSHGVMNNLLAEMLDGKRY